jgi:hypothetical protein
VTEIEDLPETSVCTAAFCPIKSQSTVIGDFVSFPQWDEGFSSNSEFSQIGLVVAVKRHVLFKDMFTVLWS